ncbi:Beta/Gamma crystallin [Nitrosospira sp. Nl5]|uniref:beta/gamma crystallin domain-containing protein n=1 Tax=Nitrosospira sp. Nl5 TaxID=200120 RepID=UPI00088D3C52|nr:beta/gamma crystallin domain-containing protein [Nitrosospira sp. Nl5]SCY04849.1 Beta/Gamma crystallin [Nitrosospira sp. Nl5]
MRKMIILATLLTSLLALVTIPAATAQDTTPGKNEDKGRAATAPVILLVPPMFAVNPSLADGCWARLFDDQDYRGDVLTLAGPIDIPSARVGENLVWGRKYDSVIVGPKATLTIYDNQNYQDKTATFKAGQRIPDLNEKLGPFENIRSLKIACSK